MLICDMLLVRKLLSRTLYRYVRVIYTVWWIWFFMRWSWIWRSSRVQITGSFRFGYQRTRCGPSFYLTTFRNYWKTYYVIIFKKKKNFEYKNQQFPRLVFCVKQWFWIYIRMVCCILRVARFNFPFPSKYRIEFNMNCVTIYLMLTTVDQIIKILIG